MIIDFDTEFSFYVNPTKKRFCIILYTTILITTSIKYVMFFEIKNMITIELSKT